jgi:hypothetical protein
MIGPDGPRLDVGRACERRIRSAFPSAGAAGFGGRLQRVRVPENLHRPSAADVAMSPR